jgi:O-antigen ligase
MKQSATVRDTGGVAALVLLLAASIGMLASGSPLFAVVTPLLIAGGALLLMYPVLGLFLVAGTIPLEAALMVGGRSMAALIGIGAFGAWALQKLLRREPIGPLFSPAIIQVSLLLFAFACLSLLWAEYTDRMQRQLVLLLQLVLLSVLVFDLASSWNRIAWVAKLLVIAGTIAALMTLEQHFVGGVRRAGDGIVGGLNRTATTLVTILPFAFYLFRSKEGPHWRLLGLAYIGLSAGAVAVTLSRMNFLVFPLVVTVSVALMARARQGRGRVLLLGGAAALGIALMPVETVRERAETILPYISRSIERQDYGDSHSARGYRYRVGFEMFRDRPMIGVGFHNYRQQFLNYQWRVPGYQHRRTGIILFPTSPHSSHIGFLADLGLIGFVLWISLNGAAVRNVWKTWRASSITAAQRAPLIQATGIAVGLQLLYGFYGDVHQDKIFWVLLGLSVALVRLVTDREEQHGAAPLARPYAQSPS